MNPKQLYIKHITIENLWNKYQINWELDPQVSILFGLNGSGKTTILELIALHKTQKSTKKNLNCNVIIQYSYDTKNIEEVIDPKIAAEAAKEDIPKMGLLLFNTFDIPVANKAKLTNGKSPLLLALEDLIYNANNEKSFVKYQLKRLDSSSNIANNIERHIHKFYQIIDSFFADTQKKIQFKDQALFFLQDEKERIDLIDLSAGEKQLLFLFLNLLIQGDNPFILLLDEPEISLHIAWQQKLIDAIIAFCPHCQIIIATHSPSIFGKHWLGKMVRMEDISKKI